MSNKEIVDIRVILEGDIATKFLAIKKSKGVSNNTEVFRSVINDFFNEHEAALSKFSADVYKEA